MGSKVVAKQLGFYKGARVHPGTEFVFEGDRLPKWVAVVAAVAKAATGDKVATAEEVIASLKELGDEALEVLRSAEEARGNKARKTVLEAIAAEVIARAAPASSDAVKNAVGQGNDLA